MSAAARDICDLLRSDPEIQSIAVKIVNRNLNSAIGRVLNFTGDRLTRLLGDVRRHLRIRGQEMILLVEDLARLQGLDVSLLEALIEEGTDGNGSLYNCVGLQLSQRGTIQGIPDTVKTRMNFVLYMDLPTSGEYSPIDDESIVAFSAKYLNAARLNPDELKSWAMLPEKQRGEAPTACDDCAHRTQCHGAFGFVGSVGLYPFNRDSLLNMLRRFDSRVDERFTPRVLVKEVLAEVMGTYGRDLENERFPSPLLLSQMGGSRLPPVIADGLRREDPDRAERQLAVLELWGSRGSEVN